MHTRARAATRTRTTTRNKVLLSAPAGGLQFGSLEFTKRQLNGTGQSWWGGLRSYQAGLCHSSCMDFPTAAKTIRCLACFCFCFPDHLPSPHLYPTNSCRCYGGRCWCQHVGRNGGPLTTTRPHSHLHTHPMHARARARTHTHTHTHTEKRESRCEVNTLT